MLCFSVSLTVILLPEGKSLLQEICRLQYARKIAFANANCDPLKRPIEATILACKGESVKCAGERRFDTACVCEIHTVWMQSAILKRLGYLQAFVRLLSVGASASVSVNSFFKPIVSLCAFKLQTLLNPQRAFKESVDCEHRLRLKIRFRVSSTCLQSVYNSLRSEDLLFGHLFNRF